MARDLARLRRKADQFASLLSGLVQAAGPNAADLAEKAIHAFETCREDLAGHAEGVEAHARRADDLNGRLYREILASRMRPLSDGLHTLPRVVRDLARHLHKEVLLHVQGETTGIDRDILEKLDSPLNHLVRNALDHGLETPEERRRVGKPESGVGQDLRPTQRRPPRDHGVR